jgi:endonuclease V
VDTDDNLPWSLTTNGLPPEEAAPLLCAGADVSFSATDSSSAVATLTVVALESDGRTRCVYSSSKRVAMVVPYAPSFLAFREAPFIALMVAEMPATLRSAVAVLLVDGNGVLHPRGAGLACHVALESGVDGLPTIGCSKALLCFDGLAEKEVRSSTAAIPRGQALPLIGDSGRTWGAAMLTGKSTAKPIYISVGHRVSLATATKLVLSLCVYRIPEPIRLADHHSREALRGNPIAINDFEKI